jgi:hypothetical protein
MVYTDIELIEYCKSHIAGYGIDSAIAKKFIEMVAEIEALNEKIDALRWE